MFLLSVKEWNIILWQFFFNKNTMLSESTEMQMNILTPFSKTGIYFGRVILPFSLHALKRIQSD